MVLSIELYCKYIVFGVFSMLQSRVVTPAFLREAFARLGICALLLATRYDAIGQIVRRLRNQGKVRRRTAGDLRPVHRSSR